MRSLGFTQGVTFPTHTEGHLLDGIFFRELTVQNKKTLPVCWSDHLFIIFSLCFNHISKRPHPPTPVYKRLSEVITDDTMHVIVNKLEAAFSHTEGSKNMLGAFNNIVSAEINKCCPLKTSRSQTHHSPWCTSELKQMKQANRRIEARRRKHRKEEDRLLHRAGVVTYKTAIVNTKQGILGTHHT